MTWLQRERHGWWKWERERERERERNTRALTIAEWLLFRRAFYFGLRCPLTAIFLYFFDKIFCLYSLLCQIFNFLNTIWCFLFLSTDKDDNNSQLVHVLPYQSSACLSGISTAFCRLWLFFFLFILFAKIKIITNVKISFLRKKRRRRRRRRKFCGRFCLIYYIEYVMPLDGRQVLSYNLFWLLYLEMSYIWQNLI